MLRPGTGGTPEPAASAVDPGTKEGTKLDRALEGASIGRAPDGPSLGRAPERTPLYVHLPFCAAKCHYCDFFSVPAEGQDRGAMIGAILAEAERFAPRNPPTVYFGGGTPSLLDARELERLFDGLDRITGFRSSAREVTAECNPESLDEAKARALLRLGVGRLSIGIQSLHDDVLALFGRVHSAEDGLRAYAAARRAGAPDVNVDLIYAVPGQTAETWSRDLDRILDLEPDHVSAYNLTFEEETPFRRWLDEGKLARSSEEIELDLFWITREKLGARGYEAYEISNFARAGRRCLHNVNYWANGAYLGVGPSAVSKVGSTRAGNLKGTGAYVRRIGEGGNARVWSETPSAANRLAETWWLGLRLREGVRPADARRVAGLEGDAELGADRDPAIEVAERLEADGLLERSDGRFRLTQRGLPLADWIARRFLERAGVG